MHFLLNCSVGFNFTDGCTLAIQRLYYLDSHTAKRCNRNQNGFIAAGYYGLLSAEAFLIRQHLFLLFIHYYINLFVVSFRWHKFC